MPNMNPKASAGTRHDHIPPLTLGLKLALTIVRFRFGPASMPTLHDYIANATDWLHVGVDTRPNLTIESVLIGIGSTKCLHWGVTQTK